MLLSTYLSFLTAALANKNVYITQKQLHGNKLATRQNMIFVIFSFLFFFFFGQANATTAAAMMINHTPNGRNYLWWVCFLLQLSRNGTCSVVLLDTQYRLAIIYFSFFLHCTALRPIIMIIISKCGCYLVYNTLELGVKSGAVKACLVWCDVTQW